MWRGREVKLIAAYRARLWRKSSSCQDVLAVSTTEPAADGQVLLSQQHLLHNMGHLPLDWILFASFL